MKFRSFTNPHRGQEIGIIPLVNIVFLLLIFFMLVGRITPLDVLPVEPPRSDSGDSLDARETMVLLSADGRIAVGDLEVPEELLLSTVTSLLEASANTTLRVKADAAADADQLVRITEILRRAGVKRILLLTTVSG